MNEWLDDLADLAAAGEPAVVVTVAGIRGSAPRETGAKMIVTAAETIGTIGGGQLEYQCARIAVGMLGAAEVASSRSFPLGPQMGQCCGGVVDVLFEPMAAGLPGWLAELCALHGQREAAVLVTGIGECGGKFVVAADRVSSPGSDPLPPEVLRTAHALLAAGKQAERLDDYFLEAVVGSTFNIAVFGAGHVGAAVTRLLSELECNIRWIDNRRNIFRQLPANVRAIEAAEPALEVAALPADSYYLVMTHSHALDFEICDRILRRPDIAYCGLIGSRSKRRRFLKRFRAEGMSETALRGLTCPIGVDGISGKKPAVIAVATAAELLRAREQQLSSGAAGFPDNVRSLRRH
ncbi:MAG TPA: xanthine dehydrogenase accessory protein XdhC [Woeseiaceae bacterium]|nr:xanthine dehydrogenase accessory protein XdhC [Woeseiaceae bacterium]